MKKLAWFGFTFATLISVRASANDTRAQLELKRDDNAHRALTQGTRQLDALLTKIDERIASRDVHVKNYRWSWDELERYQAQMWRAMALDPARLDAKEIPSGLDPVQITRELRRGLDSLKAGREVAQNFNATEAFDAYVQFCDELLSMRETARYTQARLLVKRGTLETRYAHLVGELEREAKTGMELSFRWADADREAVGAEFKKLRRGVSELKESLAASPLRAPAQEGNTAFRPGAPAFELLRNFAALVLLVVFATGFLGGWIFRRFKAPVARREEFETERH